MKISDLKIVVVGIGLLLLCCRCTSTSKVEARVLPNVVLILADDMGYGEIEALDPEQSKIPTPTLNRLASEGMVFTDAHTSSSVCTPSRYTMLTGRYNWRTRLQSGVVQGGAQPLIAADRMTLGHLFQKQGYNTALVGKWHLEYQYQVPDSLKAITPKKEAGKFLANVPIGTKIPDGPITRGFNSFYGFHHSRAMSSFVRNDKITEEIPVVDVLPTLTQEVSRLIDTKAQDAKNGKPFFIYFAQNAPHTPIVPSKEWVGKTDLGKYGDFVAQTDGSVGKVLEALERNGLSENPIVIFTSDNGTSKLANIPELQSKGHYPSAGLRGSKSDLWDGGHRVPFIVRWPNQVEAHSQSEQLICLADLMATFADYFSFEIPEYNAEDSKSFLNALFGKSLEYPRNEIVHHSIEGRFSIRQNEWKLLLAPGSGGWSSPKDFEALEASLPEMQLYNLNQDLGETTNLVAQYPEKVDALVGILKEYIKNGRSTTGTLLENDVDIDIWKEESNYRKTKP
ncbi:sulfatase family protein [Formosa haliotis]|uniref:sulfatase family protein n=1 Tax=Formosa haliotis TaxID=1555194 RepID=UPI000824F4C3|nr:arylsulfatase [Formosa haliotis]